MTNNPNAPDNNGATPIYWAAVNGHTEIVKILVPLTDNPNAPNKDGKTPIYWAAKHGHTEIVKILAPLTDNDGIGHTHAIEVAKNEDIRKILKSLQTSRKCKAGPSTKPSKKQAKKY